MLFFLYVNNLPICLAVGIMENVKCKMENFGSLRSELIILRVGYKPRQYKSGADVPPTIFHFQFSITKAPIPGIFTIRGQRADPNRQCYKNVKCKMENGKFRVASAPNYFNFQLIKKEESKQ